MAERARNDRDLSLASILPLVRASLKGRGSFTFDAFVYGVWPEMGKVGIAGTGPVSHDHDFSRTDPKLRNAVTEAFFYLFHCGFIAPEASEFPQHPRFYTYFVTPRGLAWAEGVEALPEDVDGYMKLLNTLVPNLDAVVEQYVREGLRSFERQTFLAAAVMIGAAAEKAVYLLAESTVGAVREPTEKQKITKVMERRRLFELLDLVAKTIEANNNVIPYSVSEGAAPHLMSLFEAIRVQRNDAVHPMNKGVSSDSVRLTFKAFPHALQKLESLRAWFQANPSAI